ncbi:MAG: sulfatase-like hydrolase/transferase [Alphaproteobacteria bacterium]|nr:sulfatase-like hydrolase/transferase [Alphaproteobacteria bacterium]
MSSMASARPNILFILADDLGYADVSCYGRRDFTTPNIDRIAAEGVRFTQAYANSAVCTASRVALITGRYQYRLAVGLEEPLSTRLPRKLGLPADHPTLPSLLKRAGYQSALIGKWHLGQLPDFGPLQSGYDYFYGFRSGAVDYFTHKSGPATTETDDLWEDDVEIRQTGYLTDLLGARAVNLVETYAGAGEPFLISLHFSAPHWPWEAPGDEAEAQRLRNLFHYDGGTQRTYQRMIQQMDLQIGRVLQALDATGAGQNTIVVFTSDNGGERYSDTWPFTGRKTELLEGGLRIPAVIRWPGRIPCGTVSEQVTIGMDWSPTLLTAAGIAPDPRFPSDGVDLLPGLTQAAVPVPRKLFWRYKLHDQQAARIGDWKYLKILDNTFLFDVVQDPTERANLKERHRDVYDGLVAEWNAWNATMLPLDPQSFTHGFTGAELADHFGVR